MLAASVVPAAEPPAALIELVRSALASDESIARAESRIRRAQADVKLSSAVLLPRFDINGSYTRYQDEQVLELSPEESFVIRPSSSRPGPASPAGRRTRSA
jgi:outer membrane protein TolC